MIPQIHTRNSIAELSQGVWRLCSQSIDWFKGNITGKSYISLENIWLPVEFPLSQPIDSGHTNQFSNSMWNASAGPVSGAETGSSSATTKIQWVRGSDTRSVWSILIDYWLVMRNILSGSIFWESSSQLYFSEGLKPPTRLG